MVIRRRWNGFVPTSRANAPRTGLRRSLPPIKQPAGTPGKRNDNYSTNLPPAITKVEFSPTNPPPRQNVTVRATVADADGVKSVTLRYRTATTGRESTETPLEMKRISGEEKNGVYEATIDGQLQGTLVRFRIKAADAAGMERMQPSENEPCWTYSYYTFSSTAKAAIPLGFVINVGHADRGDALRRAMPWRMPGASAAFSGSDTRELGFRLRASGWRRAADFRSRSDYAA